MERKSLLVVASRLASLLAQLGRTLAVSTEAVLGRHALVGLAVLLESVVLRGLDARGKSRDDQFSRYSVENDEEEGFDVTL